MRFESKLRGILSRYIDTGDRKIDQAAEDAAVAAFRIFYVAHRIWVVDTVETDFATDVTRAIVDLSFALSMNPFWKANAAYLQPILANATMTWSQSPRYMDRAMNTNDKDPERLAHDRSQALQTQAAFLEIIMAVLSLSVPDFFEKAVDIRDELTRFKEQHLYEA